MTSLAATFGQSVPRAELPLHLCSRTHRPKLILLDCDQHSMDSIAAVAKPYYQIVQTTDARWAMAWLALYRDVAVLLVEEDLGDELGSRLLQRAKIMRPDVLRVLMSRDIDHPLIVQSLKRGAIERLLEKPMARESLLAAIAPQHVGYGGLPHLIVA